MYKEVSKVGKGMNYIVVGMIKSKLRRLMENHDSMIYRRVTHKELTEMMERYPRELVYAVETFIVELAEGQNYISQI